MTIIVLLYYGIRLLAKKLAAHTNNMALGTAAGEALA